MWSCGSNQKWIPARPLSSVCLEIICLKEVWSYGSATKRLHQLIPCGSNSLERRGLIQGPLEKSFWPVSSGHSLVTFKKGNAFKNKFDDIIQYNICGVLSNDFNCFVVDSKQWYLGLSNAFLKVWSPKCPNILWMTLMKSSSGRWFAVMGFDGREGGQSVIHCFFHEFVAFVKIFSLVIKKLEVICLSVLTPMFSFIGLRVKSLLQALPKVDLHHVSSSGGATTF